MEETIEDDSVTHDAATSRRIELGAFLRHRRSMLDPARVGLRGGVRRRVKGLRREEVATAAAIGVSWYTMLEQGRVERVSMRTLDALADALALTPPERAHLHHLASDAFGFVPAAAATPPPILLAYVRRYPVGGAFLHDARFDVIASNAWADAFFDFSRYGERPNLLEVMLRNPALRARFVEPDWHGTLERMVGHFRAAFAAHGSDEHLALARRLGAESADFAAIWRARPVLLAPTERHAIAHPQFGAMDVHVLPFENPACPSCTMIVNDPVVEDDVAPGIST